MFCPKCPDLRRISGILWFALKWRCLLYTSAFDEDEILRRIELHVDEMPKSLTDNKHLIYQLIEKRRRILKDKILREHPEIFEKLEKHRKKLEERLEHQRKHLDKSDS